MAFGNVFNGWKIDGISFGLSLAMTDGSQMIIPWIPERGNCFSGRCLKLVGHRWKFIKSWIHELSKLKNNLVRIYF